VITSSSHFIITIDCSVLQRAAVCYMVLQSIARDVVQLAISSSAHCVYFECTIITLCCNVLQRVTVQGVARDATQEILFLLSYIYYFDYVIIVLCCRMLQ